MRKLFRKLDALIFLNKCNNTTLIDSQPKIFSFIALWLLMMMIIMMDDDLMNRIAMGYESFLYITADPPPPPLSL